MSDIGNISRQDLDEALRRIKDEIANLQDAPSRLKGGGKPASGGANARMSALSVVDGSSGGNILLPQLSIGDMGKSLVIARVDSSRRACFIVPFPGDRIDGHALVVLPYGGASATLTCLGSGSWTSVGDAIPEGGCFQNPDGGTCTRLKNDTGSASVYGEVVEVGSVARSYAQIPADDPDPIGAVWEPGIVDGEWVSIVTHGRMQVRLMENTGASIGNWVRASATEAGTADASAATPPSGSVANIDKHMREIGHASDSATAGGAGTWQLLWIMGHQL